MFSAMLQLRLSATVEGQVLFMTTLVLLSSFVSGALMVSAQDGPANQLTDEMRRLTAEGNYSAAMAIVPQAIEVAEGPMLSHRSSALLRNQIGLLQQLLGQLAESERTYTRAIRLIEKQDPWSPAMAYLLRNLASLYLDTGEPGHAEAVGRRALEVAARVEPQSPELGLYYYTLGAARHQQGDRREAKILYKQALGFCQNDVNSKVIAALVLGSLGGIEALDRQWEPAIRHIVDSIALHRELYGPNHPASVRPNLNLAHLQILRRHWVDAAECVQTARDIAESRLGPGHPIMTEILSASATVLRHTGHREEARDLDLKSKAIAAAHPSKDAVKTRVHIADLVKSGRK